VGNLPPGATVIDLKDHFSREATNDILSVFLISKSNCAFVNYKTEESCTAAMNRFHDSRFQGVRLVCRLRRSSTHVAPGVPTGPAALPTTQPAVVKTPSADEAETQEEERRIEAKERDAASSLARDKYFIVKSLTVEDLELSVRNEIWATQSHNEEALNKAYEVWLILL
jgi:RNA recognition motif-containing protein